MMQRDRKSIALCIALIIILGLAVYADSLCGKFIYDDNALIQHNEDLKSFSKLPRVLSEDLGSGVGVASNFYRPLQVISFMLDYSLWGTNPAGYHLTNIILHILVTLSLFWMLNLIFGSGYGSLALLTALFYLVHPLHTETVAYISGRADSIAALFILLCLILYIKQGSLKSSAVYFLMLLSYLAGLYSKEYSLITPLLILLYSRIFRKKLLLKEFISLCAITAVFIAFRLAISQARGGPEAHSTLMMRLPGFFLAMLEYIRLLFLPFDLRMGYGNQLFSWQESRAIMGLAVSVILLAAAFTKRNSKGVLSFAIFWFFITLLPQANLYPINAFMAEHWLYLPAMGFCLILSSWLIAIRSRYRLTGTVLILLVIIFYSFLTVKQNMTWREPVSFYKRYLRYNPYDWRIYANLGVSLEAGGDTAGAIEAYKASLELNPKEANNYVRLSNAYFKLGDTEKAVQAYKEGIRINPESAFLYYRLGFLFENIKKDALAIEAYNESIHRDRNFALSFMGLARCYGFSGRREEARSSLEKAIYLLNKAREYEPDSSQVAATLAEAEQLLKKLYNNHNF